MLIWANFWNLYGCGKDIDIVSVGPEPDITLIFTLNLNLISGNQVQGGFSKIRLFPDIRVMPDIRVLT